MNISSKIVKVFLCLTLTFVFALCVRSMGGASTIEIPMDVEYSNGTEPAGITPWAVATFADTSPNTVTLILSAANLTGSEFISVWLFNFDSSLIPKLLSFTAVSSQDSGPITITTGSDAFGAGPSKYYDIKFGFPTSNGKSSNRFTSGESIVYDITYSGAGAITASSFNFGSSRDSAGGPYTSAMHIQGINKSKSGWIGNTTVVPEPVSSILFLSGGALFGLRRYLKKK